MPRVWKPGDPPLLPPHYNQEPAMTPKESDKPIFIPATLQDVARGVLSIRASLDLQASLQELAKEFRRLAALHTKAANDPECGYAVLNIHTGKASAFEQAAQMLEERLNG